MKRTTSEHGRLLKRVGFFSTTKKKLNKKNKKQKNEPKRKKGVGGG